MWVVNAHLQRLVKEDYKFPVVIQQERFSSQTLEDRDTLQNTRGRRLATQAIPI
jgi:hypothetical protein